MPRQHASAEVFLLGGLLVFGLLFGGGTGSPLITDSIVQGATIIVASSVIVIRRSTPVSWQLTLFPLLLLALVLLQLTPLPIGLARIFWPPAVRDAWAVAEAPARFGFITLSIDRTLGVFTYLMSLVLLLWALARLSQREILSVARIAGLGVAINMLMALMQLALSRTVSGVEVGLPYVLRGGAFTNANHFATLMMMLIPALVYWAFRGNKLLGFAGLAVVWVMLFGAGSAAGILGGVALATLAFLIFGDKTLPRAFGVPIASAIAIVFLVIAYRNLANESLAVDFGRLDFLKTTLAGIRETFKLGAGYGTFVQTYQIYELAKDVRVEFVNHAHNDYAELILEGGIPAALAIILYLVLIIYQAIQHRTNAMAQVAFLSIFAVLLHSTVDYPLRTMGIAFMFVLANALLFSPAATSGTATSRHRHRSDSGSYHPPAPVGGM